MKDNSSQSSFLLISIFSGLCFFILSFFVNKDIFRGPDYNITVYLQNIIPRVFDVPFSVLSLIGSTEVTFGICLIIFCAILYKNHKFFLGIFLYFLIFVIELAGKLLIYHPLPPVIFHRYALGIQLPSGFFVNTHFSFPSGHVARIIFICIILLFLTWRQKKIYLPQIIISFLIALFIASVFVSRVYLGEHWLSDVWGGVLLGISVSFLSLWFI